MARILYLHGLHSRPGGYKPTFLTGRNHEVVNPHLLDDDWDASLDSAQKAYDESRPDLVIGSSRGGAVGLNIDCDDTPLILIAPAWRRWGDPNIQAPSGTIILHSRFDQVIPLFDSRELILRSGLTANSLVVTGANHDMIDAAALAALEAAIGRLARLAG